MFPSCHNSRMTTESTTSLKPSLETGNTTPSRTLYSGHDVSKQEQTELTLPLTDSPEPYPGATSLNRQVSNIQVSNTQVSDIESASVNEQLTRKPLGHKDQHQHPSPITTSEQLLALCRERKIIIKTTLGQLIHSCPNESKVRLISKLGIFFANVDSTVKNTDTITGMLLCAEESATTQKNINHFLSTENFDVKAIALSPSLKSITSICHGNGFPKASDVDALLKLPCLYKDGQLDRQRLWKQCSSAVAGQADHHCNCKDTVASAARLRPWLRESRYHDKWKQCSLAVAGQADHHCNCKGTVASAARLRPWLWESRYHDRKLHCFHLSW